MKELKNKLQEAQVSIVSVCCSIDVVAVAGGCDVTFYRMPISKISQATLKSDVRCMCWSPNGRILCVGTAQGMVLINVEDGAMISQTLSCGIKDIKWVSGLKNETKGERPMQFLEANFHPLLLPLQEQTPETANCLSGQVIEEAMTSLSQQHYHFVLALTDDHVAHVSPFGVMKVLSMPFPSADSISSFHLLRSVLYTSEGVMRGINVKPVFSFKELSRIAVHHAQLKESLRVLRSVLVHIKNKAAEAEKELMSVIGNSPDLTEIFIKGPTTEDDHDWINAKCEPSRMQKTVDVLGTNLTDVSKMLAANVSSMLDHMCCLAAVTTNLLPYDAYGGLAQQVADLHAQVNAVACNVVLSKDNATDVLSWLLEIYKCCNKPKAAQQVEDSPVYNTQKVLDLLFAPAQWRRTTSDIEDMMAAVAVIDACMDEGGEALAERASHEALQNTTDVVTDTTCDAEILLCRSCSRYYSSVEEDKVVLTVVADTGPGSSRRWAAMKGYLPVEGCLSTSFCSNKEEDELRLLVLTQPEAGCLTLRMYTIMSEGDLTAHFSPMAPVELHMEPSGILTLQMPFESTNKAMLSSSTRGLACIAVRGGEDCSYITLIDLEDDEDDEEEEEEGMPVEE
eukprot:TRINITY_DN272_c0_g1_i1.p1 TRINITY_DN272_c0_g1~~TRINITY_DN272_c0_g1_i1.p1  ORF type:complete len:622 (+),score=174.20 TRINITY_DN272_c0_g1_i1:3321-5186(+)